MKIHIWESEEKLREGTTLRAKCGDSIEGACPAFLWDFVVMTAPLELRNVRYLCNRCRNKVEEFGFAEGRNYVYGVITEQEKALLITNRDTE